MSARDTITKTEIKVTDGDDGHITVMLGPDAADAILSALAGAGYKIVSREPTEAMYDAARYSPRCDRDDADYDDYWRTMFDAAPPHPQEKQT